MKPQLFMIQKMPDTLEIIRRCAPHQTMNNIAFPQQKLGKVRAVLTRNAGDER